VYAGGFSVFMDCVFAGKCVYWREFEKGTERSEWKTEGQQK